MLLEYLVRIIFWQGENSVDIIDGVGLFCLLQLSFQNNNEPVISPTYNSILPKIAMIIGFWKNFVPFSICIPSLFEKFFRPVENSFLTPESNLELLYFSMVSSYLDFDGDDMLGYDDLQQVIERLTGPQRLSDLDSKQLIQNLLEEADLDDDGSLSYAEFEHIISKSPDFTRYVLQ
jgi:EF-hand domain pair